VLETLEVDLAIGVIGQIGDEVGLELGQRGVGRRVHAGQVDLQRGIGDEGVRAGCGDVVLGRPSQTDPLAWVVSGHRVLGGIGIADWVGPGLAASDVASDLVVVSSVHSESRSRILAERARVTSTHRSIPILSGFGRIVCTCDPGVGVGNGQIPDEGYDNC
jgi:hypothetical protein